MQIAKYRLLRAIVSDRVLHGLVMLILKAAYDFALGSGSQSPRRAGFSNAVQFVCSFDEAIVQHRLNGLHRHEYAPFICLVWVKQMARFTLVANGSQAARPFIVQEFQYSILPQV